MMPSCSQHHNYNYYTVTTEPNISMYDEKNSELQNCSTQHGSSICYLALRSASVSSRHCGSSTVPITMHSKSNVTIHHNVYEHQNHNSIKSLVHNSHLPMSLICTSCCSIAYINMVNVRLLNISKCVCCRNIIVNQSI